MKIPISEIALVFWQDAAWHPSEVPPQSIHSLGLSARCFSCGMVVAEDDDTISLALDYFVESDVEDAYARHTITIPKAVIFWEYRAQAEVNKIVEVLDAEADVSKVLDVLRDEPDEETTDDVPRDN